MVVNNQLVCLLLAGIFEPIMFSWFICFFQFKWYACELIGVAKRNEHYKQQHLSVLNIWVPKGASNQGVNKGMENIGGYLC